MPRYPKKWNVVSVMTDDAKWQDVFIVKGRYQKDIQREAEVRFLDDKFGGVSPEKGPELITQIVYKSRWFFKANLVCSGFATGVNLQYQ